MGRKNDVAILQVVATIVLLCIPCPVLCGGGEEFCQKENTNSVQCAGNEGPESASPETVCKQSLPLEEIEEKWAEVPDKIFYVESSDRPYLTPRQACSVESSARNSGLSAVLVVMTSERLDLPASNATCQLLIRFPGVVHFRRVDKAKVFQGTPIEQVRLDGKFESSPTPIVHYSDAIRMVLLSRYGGWYSDLDMVVIRPLTDLPGNSIASDQATEEELARDPDNWGNAVCNAMMHFDKGHPLIEASVAGFPITFTGRWSSGGPDLITAVLAQMCGAAGRGKIQITRGTFTPERCQGVNVLPPKTFYPFGWFNAGTLRKKKRDEEWDKFFSSSHSVHFFQSSHTGGDKIMRPKNYGRDRPAMLYLALNHCPAAYYAQRIF